MCCSIWSNLAYSALLSFVFYGLLVGIFFFRFFFCVDCLRHSHALFHVQSVFFGIRYSPVFCLMYSCCSVLGTLCCSIWSNIAYSALPSYFGLPFGILFFSGFFCALPPCVISALRYPVLSGLLSSHVICSRSIFDNELTVNTDAGDDQVTRVIDLFVYNSGKFSCQNHSAGGFTPHLQLFVALHLAMNGVRTNSHLVMIGTNYTGSCKSNYYAITIRTVPVKKEM